MALNSDRKRIVDEILGPRDGKKPSSAQMGALQAVIGELIEAVHSKDAAGAEAALRSAFAELGNEAPPEFGDDAGLGKTSKE